MFRPSVFSLVVLSWLAASQTVVAQDYTADTEAALTTLQTWYNESNGLWVPSTGWWNSANCMTMLGDFAAVDSNVQSEVSDVFANTFVEAQKYNLQMVKVVMADYNVQTFYGPNYPDMSTLDLAKNITPPSNTTDVAVNPKGFLNGYYDDEGWWALGWIQAYDVTKNQAYLTAAADIFEDMKNGSTTPCGGIWWDKAHTYVNAIANELFLSVGAHLANRMSNKQYYLQTATAQWNWLQNSGMLNSKSLFNDGLTLACKNNNETVWTYNQGVVLGGLVELNIASPNSTYLTTASTIAKAAITALSTNGVLHDPCEPNCGVDGSQFKGIFMRNLQRLQQAAPDKTFLEFIATNAASIWSSDRNTSNNELGIVWSGLTLTPNASTQSSAMDALVAATAFKGNLSDAIIS